MKRFQKIFSLVLVLALLLLIVVFVTGLLRFGWVDIPYKEATAITVTNTLLDGFAFEITDSHYVEHITTALDDLGLVFSTPADGRNGALYSLELTIADTKSYYLSILDEGHFLVQGRRCRRDMTPILDILAPLEEDARAAQRREDFQLALDTPSEGSGQQLARDLEANPEQFLEQLSRTPMEDWDGICRQIADHHSLNGTTDAYVTFLLNLYPTRYGDLHCLLLTITYPTLQEKDVPLTDAALHALPYTDGAASEYTAQLLYDLFLLDGKTLVERLAMQETDIQKLALSQILYAAGGSMPQPQFTQALEVLLDIPGLTAEQETLAQELSQQLNATTKAPETPTGYPSGSVQLPQIRYEGDIYYYTANGFDVPLPLGYLLVGAVQDVDDMDPPTENWCGSRVSIGQAIYAKKAADSIYVEYDSGFAEFRLRK